MRRLLTCICALWMAGPAYADSVSDSPHNLSVTGPGATHAAGETQICVFCHATHNASPQAPLWNRRDPGGTYQAYWSSTLSNPAGQPTGASRVCLSCHDGTVATGEVLSRSQPIAMVGVDHLQPGGGGLSLNLADDHPISMNYEASRLQLGQTLKPVPTLNGQPVLDEAGEVQCTACHDPHDNVNGNFLRADPRGDLLCGACHRPEGWSVSAHANAPAPRPLNGGWPADQAGWTVSEGACRNCHRPHDAPAPQRLLRGTEEAVCLTCHSGDPARPDIGAEMTKWSAHDVTATTGRHDAAETPTGRADHVECVDCHDPHRANADRPGDPTLAGANEGVSGLTEGGALVDPAVAVYQICFKCHSDPAYNNPTRIPRVFDTPDISAQLRTTNPTFHPVLGEGNNPDVPSLLPGWTTVSHVSCLDCHGNDQGPVAGGNGPRGPHGSRWPWLLALRYETADFTPESGAAFALCYRCHDRTSILADDSFKEHDKHVRKENTPCSVCHTPHGTSGATSHLINFDTRVVQGDRNGVIRFQDNGRFAGSCTLTCHGQEHRAESY